MRFNLLLGIILCIFSANEMNASTIKKDSLNPLYPDLANAYQLKIQNLQVLRSLGKNVKLKYDIVNTGKHIVKLGKGRKIPNAMSIVFDDEMESGEMSNYKAQIAEQILKQDLFLQSGKSSTQKEVKVNLNAPAKLAHLIGSDNGSRLSENTMDEIKNGVGSLGNRASINDDYATEVVDTEDMANYEDEVDDMEEMDDFGEAATEIEMEEEVPAFSNYTEKVTEIDNSKPYAKTSEKVKRTRTKVSKKKKVTTEVVADDVLESDFEEELDVDDMRTKELPDVNELEGEADFGTTSTSSETTLINNSRSRGSSIVKKTKSYKEVESEDGTETHTIKKTTKRISAIQAYPEDDSILATLKKKRKAKRETAKKEAMGMKADAAGSEVYDDEESEIETRELTPEELDTSENLETERAKWYEGFKPYAVAEDFEEHQTNTYTRDPEADEFLDKTTCPDLTLNDIEVVKTGKKWVTVEFMITNIGKGPARIYGTTPKEADNVYIKAFLSGSTKVSRGATTLGGMYINKGVSNKAGKLMPDESMKLQMKIDIRKRTKFTTVLILDLDAFGNCRECDETNNKQHVVLK